MADLKISQLTAATTPLAGTETVPIVQSGTTKKVTVADLTTGRAVSASSVSVGTISTFFSAKVNVLGDGTNSPVFVSTNGASNNTKYNAVSFSTDNTTYSAKVQVARYSGSYDLGLAIRLVNNTATEFQAVDLKSNGDVSIDVGNLQIGTAGKGVQFTGNGGVIWRCGAGTPEGAVIAAIGSLFTRTDGGANTTLYVKESGTGNTGWVAK